MEMSIPRSIRAEISENGDIRRNQGRYWEDIEATMPAKRNRNHRSGAVQRPRTYAHQDSAEVQRIANHGISQRKEQSDDIRQARKPQDKYGNRHFWARGYYVDTVGRNKKQIQEYIKNQLTEDQIADQVELKEFVDPFTGSVNKKA